MKKIGMLTAFATLFSLTTIQAQVSTCTVSDTQSGNDGAGTTATVNDFSCADNVANAYRTGISVDCEIGTFCGSNSSWYDFSILVDGEMIADDLCEGVYDLADYGIYDFNSIGSISIVSEDNDNYPTDNVTMVLEAEIEYTIMSCPPPGSLSVDDITSSTALFDWDPNGSELLWDIELVDITAGDTATGVATTSGLIDHEFAFTGLTPENEYEVYVRANCVSGTDPISTWIGPINFTTDPTCFPVSGVLVESITDVSAFAQWASIESEWEIELINLTTSGTFTGNPTELAIADTSFSFISLIPENDYSFKVRANCGPVDGNGAWSDAVNFTTLPSCIAPTDIITNSISDNSINISWVSNDDEASWGIELINIDNGESADGTADYTSTDTTYTVTGLLPNTTYQIFVNAECSSTDQSDWTSMASFTTLCTPYTMPYVDSLNNWLTDCYELSSTTGDDWSQNGSSDIQANMNEFSAGFSVFEMGEVSVDDAAILEFDWSSASDNSTDRGVTVAMSIDGGTSYADIWTKYGSDLFSNDGATTNSPGSFATELLLLPDSVIGTNVKFRFTAQSGFFDAEFFLDEIRVNALPDCNPAYNLAVDSTNQTEAFVSFTDITGDNSVSWDYTATSATDTITGNTTSTPFTITGLSSGVSYTLSINTLCGSDSAMSSTITFETECGSNSYYVQDFESTPTGNNNIPLCWMSINETTSTSSDVEVTNGGNGSARSLRLYNGGSSSQSSTDVIAITPQFSDINLNWMKFEARTTSSTTDNQFIIGYMTDYTDEDTFEGLDTIDLTTTWTEHFFKPSDYASFTGERIAIKGIHGGAWRTLLVDNVVWEEIPTCYFPVSLAIDSTTQTSVYATVDPYLPADAVWQLEIINLTTGEVYTGIPTDTVSTSTFFVDGLDHSTVYQLKIRTECGSTASIWSSYTVDFATKCAPVTDFVQGWENGSHCWNLIAESNTGTVLNQLSTTSTFAGSFANNLDPQSQGDPGEHHNIITVSPEISNIAAGTHWIKLMARKSDSWDETPTLEFGTMSDPEDASTFTALASHLVPSTTYSEFHHSFVGYTGTDTYIAYRLKTSDDWDNLRVDDVIWEEAPECATPENLTGVDIADIYAEIDWTPVSADTAWYVEIVNLSAGGSLTGVATDSTTTHPFTFTGLDQNTTYLAVVKAHCDTNWSIPFTFQTLISHDVEVSNFVSPIANACMLTTAEEVVVTLTNNGAQDATGFDVQYSFDGVSFTSDGAFTGTLLAGTDTAYSLSTMFDFSNADDTTLTVAISYAVDTINNTNDTNSISITNLGDQLIQLEVTPSAFAGEMSWNVIDTAASTTVASVSTGTYSTNGPALSHDVCVKVGTTYKMEAWDSYGDGWNGGVYEITQCGGVLVADNGGLSPSTLPNSGGSSLEAFEYFTIEECDDYDLGIISMDSINSSCGLTAAEQGYLLVQNYGLMDITPAMNVSVEYQVNGAGWSTLASFTNFASGADTLLALPTTDMSTPLTYSFEFLVTYALDENASNDTLELDIESVDTYTEITPAQDFEDAASGWTVHIDNGAIPSWEWGEPTTPMIGAGNNDGKAWVTRLNDNMYLNEESYILSPCFDFSGYTNDAEVQFDFIWTTPSSNTVRLQVSTDGGATWPSIFTSNDESILMPQNTTEWTNRIELFDLAGEGDVKFRFYINNGFSVDAEGFGMDNFSVFEHVPYTDTTLSALFVEGDTIDGFDPAVFDYDYIYPYGETDVSNYTVSAIVNAPFFESMVITQPTSLPGTGTVVVTAEDTNFTGTYTINFIEADPSTNAYLSDLSSGGSPVDGFDSLVMVYYDTVAYGTTLPIAIDATVADPTATYTVDYATVLAGSTTVTVTAQDGVTTNSYVINYYETPADSNSDLINIQVGGFDVVGFHTDTLDYTVEISTASSVIGFASSSDATVTYSPTPGPYNTGDVVTITVTAQDGSTTEYTVTLTTPLSDNNYLTDISIDGTPITGFDSTVLVYDVNVPFGTDLSSYDVTYITSDAGATASDVLSGNVAPATTTIVVVAADGSTRTYVINWGYDPASSDCSLLDLSINYGTLYQSGYTDTLFDSGVTEYVAWFDAAEVSVFPTSWNINAVTQDPTAVVDISPVTSLSNTVTITVTAQDGSECIYTIDLVNGVGTNELETGSVSIYPNPSNGMVNVSVVESIANYSVEVFTPNGQKVFTNNFSNENAKLDLSAYADGIYYVTVTDVKTGKSLREKITILK